MTDKTAEEEAKLLDKEVEVVGGPPKPTPKVKETPKETVVVKEAPKEKSLSDKLTDLRNHVKNLGSVQEGSALVLNFFLDHSKEIEPVARPRVRELADAIASGTQGQPNVPAS